MIERGLCRRLENDDKLLWRIDQKGLSKLSKQKAKFFRLPVVSVGSEFLVMGHLMRRNILTYKAPPNNEGYDLICIHPDPRHQPRKGELAQVRVQVKSRYATDCDRGFPVKEASLDAFDLHGCAMCGFRSPVAFRRVPCTGDGDSRIHLVSTRNGNSSWCETSENASCAAAR